MSDLQKKLQNIYTMKKHLILLATILMAVSCTQKESTYTVKGTITDSLSTTPGAVIIMTDRLTNEKDTIQIIDGTFEITGVASDSTIKRISLATDAKIRNMNYAMFIPEKGTININLNEPSKVSGTPLNEKYSSILAYQDSVRKIMSAKIKEFNETLKGEEADNAVNEIYEKTQEQLNNYWKETYFANTSNALGHLSLQYLIYDFESVANLDEFLDKGADFIKNDKNFQSVRESMVAKEKTAEGSMFIDFSGKTPDGKDVNLSDFVGKGKYVLVDFWASWCGPCKREIPNIKAAYDKYTKKGLVVLGVAVWDGDNTNSRKTIEEMGMKWNQIFVGDDKTPTNVYGILGIPHIILFGPDGTIVKRDLRGEDLQKAVADVM